MSGLWGQTHALGQRVWVHKRFHKDLLAADAEMAHFGPAPEDEQAPGHGQAPPGG
ncbi:hypothetical protein BH23ACT2_BH23ACT2_19990 [soil metagenome]